MLQSYREQELELYVEHQSTNYYFSMLVKNVLANNNDKKKLQ